MAKGGPERIGHRSEPGSVGRPNVPRPPMWSRSTGRRPNRRARPARSITCGRWKAGRRRAAPSSGGGRTASTCCRHPRSASHRPRSARSPRGRRRSVRTVGPVAALCGLHPAVQHQRSARDQPAAPLVRRRTADRCALRRRVRTRRRSPAGGAPTRTDPAVGRPQSRHHGLISAGKRPGVSSDQAHGLAPRGGNRRSSITQSVITRTVPVTSLMRRAITDGAATDQSAARQKRMFVSGHPLPRRGGRSPRGR